MRKQISFIHWYNFKAPDYIPRHVYECNNTLLPNKSLHALAISREACAFTTILISLQRTHGDKTMKLVELAGETPSIPARA